MPDLDPASPVNTPASLNQTPPGYRHRVWMAIGGLLAFVALYLALCGWFIWMACTTISELIAADHIDMRSLFVAGCSSFLAVFMLKAVLSIRRDEQDTKLFEVTAGTQPRLFEFLHQLADEVGAPRPHRVYLSPRVNACVFYDLSVLNLLWPSRKNLELGAGLINCLNVSEFKAVCAHEFGHFAQRTMAVGRWIYVAWQIAGHIVSHRDVLDRFLRFLSGWDLRIAWIGWLLRLIVWALRSLVDAAFTLVVMAERSLSREMEFQADLVAVSLTGSDALINALYRLRAADDAWDRTLSFVGGEIRNKRIPEDMFRLQTHILGNMGKLLNNPAHGQTPCVPQDNPAGFRVFRAEAAQPPRMWASHPFSHEREENAKKIYIPAENDPASAWMLFDNPDTLRRELTRTFTEATDGEPSTPETCIARLDAELESEHLNPHYRGVYYGRSPVRMAQTVANLYDAVEGAETKLQSLYPESLTADLARLETLGHELDLLQNLRYGRMEAPDGIIRHRGRILNKKELPDAIAGIEGEIRALHERLAAHDKLCRTAHRAAASKLGNGWEDYLLGLATILHYADHSLANLRDATGLLNNTITVAMATGQVKSSDRVRVFGDSAKVFQCLETIFRQADQVALDERLLTALGIPGWKEALGDLGLLAPTSTNLDEWLKVCNNWIRPAVNALEALREAALEELLRTEKQVGQWYRDAGTSEAAPEPSRIGFADYPTLLPGTERERQLRLGWWERFLTASGRMAGISRAAVALGIVGTVLVLGTVSRLNHVTIHNGLGRTVRVHIDRDSVQVPAFSNLQITLASAGQHHISTYTESGELIEKLTTDQQRGHSEYVYNVASATPLTEWTATYGESSGAPPKPLGTISWQASSADYLFSEPPSQITSRSGNGTRLVLSAPESGSHPEEVLGEIADAAQRAALIRTHARWDPPGTRYLMDWMAEVPQEELRQIVAARLQANPLEIIALRMEQDLASKGTPEHEAICSRDAGLAGSHPESPDLQYIGIRCLPDLAARDQAYVDAYRRSPSSGWLALAAGYVAAERQEWGQALEAMRAATRLTPELAGVAGYDVVRIARMHTRSTQVPSGFSGHDAPMLAGLLAVEQGKIPEDADAPYRAWEALAHGRLADAVKLARGTPSQETILRLAACSEGASPDLVGQALQLSPGSLTETTRHMMMALSLREHANTRAYTSPPDANIQKTDTKLLDFLELARSGRFAAAEQAIDGLDPQDRGRALAMAVIVLRKSAPADWRQQAKLLLFATERPWQG